MSKAWPLLMLILLFLSATPATAAPIDWRTNSSSYRGSGAMKDGGAVLFFRQGLISYPQGKMDIVSFDGKKVILVASKGIIYYMDGSRAVKVVKACAGRVVKMAHAVTPRGGVIYALCWKPGEDVVSAATIFDNSMGVRWYGYKVASRRGEGGFIYSEYRKDFPSSKEPARPLAADMDGDGYDEAVLFLDGRLLYFDSPLSPPEETLTSSVPRGFAYGDLDGDGKGEVVIATETSISTWKPGGRINTYSKYGCTSEPVLADLDGDGVTEVACLSGSSLIAVDGNRMLLRDSGVSTLPAAADLNSDGLADLVYVTSDGTLKARSIKGTLWSSKLKVDKPFFTPAIGDIDGDYSPEVIVGAGGYLRVVSSEGREEWREDLTEPDAWVSGDKIKLTRYIGYKAETSPILYDMDGDGLLEILLGIGAYHEQGRIALINDVRGMDEPPVVEILSPANYSRVGKSFQLEFKVSDDLSPILPTKVYGLVGNDWVEEWSGEVRSGESVQLNLTSTDEVKVETTDGMLRSSEILKLRVDVEAPQLLIEPKNMSTIGPETNITVRMIAPIKEYAFLTVYHGAGPGNQWVKMIDRMRIWKTTKLQINVTSIVMRLRGYHYFRFVLEDSLGNRQDVIMRYRIERSLTSRAASGDVELSLAVPRKPVSKRAEVNWTLIGTPNATLYYGKGLEWTLLKVVKGNGSLLWDVSDLQDGTYYLKLVSGNASVIAQLEVDNTPPTVEISADRTELEVNETAILTVSTDAKKLYWDLNGDGRFETEGPNVARIMAREPGKMIIRVMGVDDANNSRIASISLEVRAPSSSPTRTSSPKGKDAQTKAGWIDGIMGFAGKALNPELALIPPTLIGLAYLIRWRSRVGRTEGIEVGGGRWGGKDKGKGKTGGIRMGKSRRPRRREAKLKRDEERRRKVRNPWRSL